MNGRKEGKKKGRKEGRKDGRKEGRKDGRKGGRKEGRTKGKMEGQKDRREERGKREGRDLERLKLAVVLQALAHEDKVVVGLVDTGGREDALVVFERTVAEINASSRNVAFVQVGQSFGK
jgi:hypothetical protein